MKNSNITDQPEDNEEVDISSVPLEQQIAIIADAVDTLCQHLVNKGVNPEVLAQTLLLSFAERMCELGDREAYEELLSQALEDEWEEYSIH